IALGSIVGGQVVEHLGLIHTPWIGALIVLLAFGLTHVSARQETAALARAQA
ncbi:MAG: MFS transporter, partial [Aeromonas sp.]